MDVSIDKFIFEINFYLENDYTLEEAANKLGISKSTLQNHIKKMKEINPELYNKVREKQFVNQQVGRVKGGQIGKRSANWTDEDALKIADVFISGEYTLEELSNVFNIPKSTVYEILTSSVIPTSKRDLIETVFYAHSRNMSLSEMKRNYNGRSR